jgi:hypothetical protein
MFETMMIVMGLVGAAIFLAHAFDLRVYWGSKNRSNRGETPR